MLSENSLRHSNFLFRLYAAHSRKEKGKRISSGEILITMADDAASPRFRARGVTWKETKSSSANEITFLAVSCLLVDIRPSSERLEGHSWTHQRQELSCYGLMVGLCPANGLRFFGSVSLSIWFFVLNHGKWNGWILYLELICVRMYEARHGLFPGLELENAQSSFLVLKNIHHVGCFNRTVANGPSLLTRSFMTLTSFFSGCGTLFSWVVAWQLRYNLLEWGLTTQYLQRQTTSCMAYYIYSFFEHFLCTRHFF